VGLSKALRFEVLRRDGFACTYCGRRPPCVELHVDHVVPAALGGADAPENLRTSCADCNAGKGSTPPDADTVAQVAEDASRWRAAIAQAAAEMEGASVDALWFVDLWNSVGLLSTRTLPADAPTTVARLEAQGLPRSVIEDMFWVAVTARGVSPSAQYRYFLGCCNNRLRDLHDRATEILGAEDE